MTEPSVTFYSGVQTVTGANFLFEFAGKKILVDCGIVQGGKDSESINSEKFSYDPKEIDLLFITHAHMDHIGRVPKLIKDGFKGEIFSTDATKSIASIMLEDAANILDRNARETGVLPMYTKAEVEGASARWKVIKYHENNNITHNFSVTAYDAGHILGSAMYKFTCTDRGKVSSTLFGGDLGNTPSVLVKDTEIVHDVDYLIMDSVYGDRNHKPKDVRDQEFIGEIKLAIARNGTVVIPAFSLERTQTILYLLDDLIEGGRIPSIPVFLDSPLAIRLTEVYVNKQRDFKDSVKKEIQDGDEIFKFPKLKMTVKSAESKVIHKTTGAKIIIAGSGMSTAGRVLHHEMRYLPDPDSTIMIIGYQASGTLGREIEEGAKVVRIDGNEVEVKSRVVKIDGFSAHKDMEGLVDFADSVSKRGSLRKIFVVLGEPKASLFLCQRIKAELGVDTIVPEKGKTYKLELFDRV
jgi:metallo-beta-lactamase family protein